MRYSVESLDYAIDTLLPSIAKAKELGAVFNRPELIDMVARQAFVQKVHEDRRHFNKSMCYHVVWEAARELDENGFMLFGEKSIKQVIGIE